METTTKVPAQPLRPEELHVFEWPEKGRDKFVARCGVCGRGRRALVHRE